MIFNTSGGGISLNFKTIGDVVQPTNPADNTLWVNSSVPVTGWEFSEKAPRVAREGSVWVVTGPASASTFNALLAGNIAFCPLAPTAARQYIAGSWVDIPGQIYQAGAWNEFWNGVLYDYGEQYIDITGGWVGSQTITGSETSGGRLTVNEDNLSFTNVSGGSFGVVTANAINLSNFNTLHVITTGSIRIQVAAEFPTSNAVAGSTFTGTETEHSVDITSVSGSFKIGVGNRGSSGSTQLHRAWLT